METLKYLNRVVKMSEPILAEDSIFFSLSLSLRTVLDQLDCVKTAHHDYLVALLLVLLAESGFCTLPASEPAAESSKSSFSDNLRKKGEIKYQNTRIVYIPSNWKSQSSEQYEVCFVLLKSGIRSKLIAKPVGDKLILNMYPYIKNKKIYSMVIKTLQYVNPFTDRQGNRYRNLRHISHRFKDKVVTPIRADICCSLELINPSLQGLPLELLTKIRQFLNERDFKYLIAALQVPIISSKK